MTAVIPAFTEPADWRHSAVCAQTDPTLFFPSAGSPAREAKRICAGCSVVAECLADAMRLSAWEDKFGGVRGGLSATEREKLRKQTS